MSVRMTLCMCVCVCCPRVDVKRALRAGQTIDGGFLNLGLIGVLSQVPIESLLTDDGSGKGGFLDIVMTM